MNAQVFARAERGPLGRPDIGLQASATLSGDTLTVRIECYDGVLGERSLQVSYVSEASIMAAASILATSGQGEHVTPEEVARRTVVLARCIEDERNRQVKP